MLPAEHTRVDVCVRRMDETLVVVKTCGWMNEYVQVVLRSSTEMFLRCESNAVLLYKEEAEREQVEVLLHSHL